MKIVNKKEFNKIKNANKLIFESRLKTIVSFANLVEEQLEKGNTVKEVLDNNYKDFLIKANYQNLNYMAQDFVDKALAVLWQYSNEYATWMVNNKHTEDVATGVALSYVNFHPDNEDKKEQLVKVVNNSKISKNNKSIFNVKINMDNGLNY